MENIVALITPFKDGNVSYEGLKSLVLKHIREKTDKLLLLGTTSEAPSLSLEEKKKIVKEVALIYKLDKRELYDSYVESKKKESQL